MRPVRDSGRKAKSNRVEGLKTPGFFNNPVSSISAWQKAPESRKLRSQRTDFIVVAYIAFAFFTLMSTFILMSIYLPLGILFALGVPTWLGISWFRHLNNESTS